MRVDSPLRFAVFPAAACAVLGAARPASAAVDSVPAACPVDESEVAVSRLLSTDALLGHDRDLCPHAAGDDEIRAAVSACGTCGFAGTAKEFQQELPEPVAERVKRELQPAATAWERYANRARILEWLEAPAQVVGESWLRAAWSVRLAPRSPGPALADAAARAAKEAPDDGDDPLLGPARGLDRKLAEGAPALRPEERAAAYYASGSLWRARGELEEAEARYAKALAVAPGGDLEPALAGAIERDRASIELERGYLRKALAHFRSGLAAGEKVPKAQRAMLAFLSAECARRTGNREEAHRLYRIAQSLADAESAEVRALVEQGLADTAPAATPGKPSRKTKKAD